jgi:NAD-dependent deacetylase
MQLTLAHPSVYNRFQSEEMVRLMLDPKLKSLLKTVAAPAGRITVMTGAGISAESGIPTFRGPEGYWTVGSKVYHPQEMATYAMFRQQPQEVWRWYLYRRGVCRRAEPNAGHLALVDLEQRWGDRFTLITQNVDGLHLRAGNTLARTYQIHGNVDYMRCAQACPTNTFLIPASIPLKTKDDLLTETEVKALRCPGCGGWVRPHVLFFDEYYNEEFFKFESSLNAADQTDLLITVGTSGATNLPHQVAWHAANRGALLIDINIQQNPFSRFALDNNGYYLPYPSGEILPELVRALVD